MIFMVVYNIDAREVSCEKSKDFSTSEQVAYLKAEFESLYSRKDRCVKEELLNLRKEMKFKEKQVDIVIKYIDGRHEIYTNELSRDEKAIWSDMGFNLREFESRSGGWPTIVLTHCKISWSDDSEVIITINKWLNDLGLSLNELKDIYEKFVNGLKQEMVQNGDVNRASEVVFDFVAEDVNWKVVRHQVEAYLLKYVDEAKVEIKRFTHNNATCRVSNIVFYQQ